MAFFFFFTPHLTHRNEHQLTFSSCAKSTSPQITGWPEAFAFNFFFGSEISLRPVRTDRVCKCVRLKNIPSGVHGGSIIRERPLEDCCIFLSSFNTMALSHSTAACYSTQKYEYNSEQNQNEDSLNECGGCNEKENDKLATMTTCLLIGP